MRERMGMEYEAMIEVVWKRVVGKGVHFVLIERGVFCQMGFVPAASWKWNVS